MTQKKIKLLRCGALCIIALITILLCVLVLWGLPVYLEGCKVLTTTARVIRFFAVLFLVFGILSYWFNDEEDLVEFAYGPIAVWVMYEALLLYFFLRVRVFGYQYFFAFKDSLWALLALNAIISAIALYLVREIRYRRILFENSTWRKPDDNLLVCKLSGLGLSFSLCILLVVLTVEGVQNYRFSPSGKVNGFGYVDLGLPSGVMWGDRNFFASDRCSLGKKTEWGQTISQPCLDWRQNYDEEGKYVMDSSDDIVSEFMGEDWFIPAEHLWEELLDECDIVPSYYNEVIGVTFKGSGKRLFMPGLGKAGQKDAIYWTATITIDHTSTDLWYCDDENCEGHVFTYLSPSVSVIRIQPSSKRIRTLVEKGEMFIHNECYIRPVMLW